MKKNIYSYEVRKRWRSVLSWLAGLLGLHLLYLPFYATFARQAAIVERAMAQFPPAFRAAFGMNGVDLATVLGYYSFVFVLVQLCLAIQAANYGFGLLSVEEAELTADFLLTRPVSRSQIWVSKVLAALTSLLVTEAATAAIAFGSVAAFRVGHPYDAGMLTKLLGSMVPFQLIFFAVGLAVSVFVRRIRNATYYGMGLGFGAYVLNAFSGTLGDTKLEWLTPFKYFDPPYLLNHGHFDGQLVVLGGMVVVIALALAYWRYLHRDIPSAA